MWKVKTWTLAQKADYLKWLEQNQHRMQIVVLYVENRYAVEYRLLKRI